MKEQSLSILFPNQDKVEYRNLPDTVWHDLGLDAVVEKVAQRPEEAELIRRVMTGLTADPAVSAFRCDVFRDILNHQEIRERMMKLLQLDPPPDGVFCQSDHIALGVCRAIREAGMSIPEDIAVVGFDNYDFASFVSPSLTTIDQPLEKIGRVALSQLRKAIDREEISEQDILLEAKLIKRTSA